MDEVIIVFHGASAAIRGEKALAEAGLSPLVMPLPSRIRAGCGICLRVRPEWTEEAKQALKSRDVSFAGLYLRRMEGGESRYEAIEAIREAKP